MSRVRARRRRKTRVLLTDEHWRTAEPLLVLDERDPRRPLRIACAVLAAVSVIVLAVSLHRDDLRCGQSCYGLAPSDRFGSQTYEPGHRWTAYASSWQWDAQSTLAFVAVIASLIAFGLAMSGRRPYAALVPGAVATVGWIAWVLLTPLAA
jgi:hypothetical protein